jgi:hypothetical protein
MEIIIIVMNIQYVLLLASHLEMEKVGLGLDVLCT